MNSERHDFEEPLPDQWRRGGELPGARIADAHIPAGAGNNDSPRPADQACAHDGDGWGMLTSQPQHLPSKRKIVTQIVG